MSTLIINNPLSVDIVPGRVTIECETGEISDGFHTFDELYAHRHELFINLMRCNPELSYRTRRHADGTEWPGWFLAVMNLPTGQISYHLPESYWDRLDGITAVEQAPSYDGHTSQDVLDRLRVWRGIKAIPASSSAD